MELNHDYNHEAKSFTGAPLLAICVLLHLLCVKAAGLHYDFSDILHRFGVEALVSVMSGVSSITLGVVMVNHYWMRNKLLKKELKEGKDKGTSEEEEEEKDKL